MTAAYDHHIHIGPYYNCYYDFHDVFNALINNGVTAADCAYLTPRFDKFAPARQYYEAVTEELLAAKEFAGKIGLNVKFLHWCDPILLNNGMSLSEICRDFDYGGLAIHPRLHDWSPDKPENAALLNTIFDFAAQNNTDIYIHTGCSDDDNPRLFEPWYRDFPNVTVHLAHCKAHDKIIRLFGLYDNLLGDTAFCPKESIEAIRQAGFGDRLLFGTDFPITHYYNYKEETNIPITEQSLTGNYTAVKAEFIKSYKKRIFGKKYL